MAYDKCYVKIVVIGFQSDFNLNVTLAKVIYFTYYKKSIEKVENTYLFKNFKEFYIYHAILCKPELFIKWTLLQAIYDSFLEEMLRIQLGLQTHKPLIHSFVGY